MRIDVHQHLLPEQLIGALGRRRHAPRIRRSRAGWLLEVAGEAPSIVVPADHDPDTRARRTRADAVDRALVALSSVLGVEGLARDESGELLDAWHRGARELPSTFGHWGAAALAEPDPADVDALLDDGAAGLSLPAGALQPARIDAVGPLLTALERRSGVLFVHPGPDPWAPPPADGGGPGWLPALTRYVAEMQTAWHTIAIARPSLPRLRVVFAMLAGLAPLHVERLQARGGPTTAVLDSNLFYDTSSYGPRAVAAMARVVGPDQLVYGSDRPVVEPHPLVGPSPVHSSAPATEPRRGPLLPFGLNAQRLFAPPTRVAAA